MAAVFPVTGSVNNGSSNTTSFNTDPSILRCVYPTVVVEQAERKVLC